jgi:hypothetical protein
MVASVFQTVPPTKTSESSNLCLVEIVRHSLEIEMQTFMSSNTPVNAPSKTGNPSGGGRGNNPPRGR